MRTRLAISVIAVAISACGGTVVETTLPVASSTSVAPATTALSTTTTEPPNTTSTTPGAVDALAPLEIPRLDGGLPATFVAVTEGWEAVEVDTATGDILRSIGRMERPGEAEDEGGVGSAIQQAWRTSDHAWYVVGECCEPAGGMMHYLGPESVLTRANHEDMLFSDGWTIAPSPFDGRIVNLGYFIRVGKVGAPADVEFWLDEGEDAASLMTVAAWDRDGGGVSWLSYDRARFATTLVHLDLTAPDSEPTTRVLDWVTGDQWLDGMGAQQGGDLVAFRNTPDDVPEAPSVALTEGVVFSPGGELIATFPVETGSFWGGYDPSGRFLIYTDGNGDVHWQGLGRSGILAAGFIHASW